MYEDEDLQEIHEDIQELNEDISTLRKDLNNMSASVNRTGENVTLNKTAEARFKTPPLPMGNSEQVQYSGKQLIPFTNQDFTLNGVRHYVQNGTLYLNGTTTTETNQRNELYKSNFSMTLPAGTYYFKRGASNIPMYIIKYDDNTNIVTNEGQFTLEETTQVYFGIYLYQRTLNNEKIDCQLELGNSATSYEPYVGGTASPNPDYPQEITDVTGDVEVVVENKNLAWNGWAEDFVERINYTPYAKITTLDNRNCLDYLASAGWKDYDRKYIFKTNFKENTQYTFMFDMFTDFHSGNICIEYTDGTTSEIRNLSITAWNNVKMVSSPNKTIKYLRAQYSNGNSWIDLDTFMVYEGTEQIDFILHKEQTFTFPLGNEKLMLGDYLADDGIHHVRGQFTMNENTLIASSAYGINSYVVTLSNRAVSNETDLLFISSHFKGIPANQRGTAPNVIYSNTAKQAEIRNTEFSTLATFKEWLEENNPVVEYVLETEQVVPYTTAQQEVYNQIKQAISYEEQTNISSNTIALFNVKAFRNMNTSIESLQSRIELLKGRS